MSGSKAPAAPAGKAKPDVPAKDPVAVSTGLHWAYVASRDGPTFEEALAAQGITLAHATEADVDAIENAREEDAAALARDKYPTRTLPDVAPGELIAVDRDGAIHKIDPNRVTDYAVRAEAPPVPPPHPLLNNVRAHLEHGIRGDMNALAAAVKALMDVVEGLLPEVKKEPAKPPAPPPSFAARTTPPPAAPART